MRMIFKISFAFIFTGISPFLYCATGQGITSDRNTDVSCDGLRTSDNCVFWKMSERLEDAAV